jgi:hypothetical protein
MVEPLTKKPFVIGSGPDRLVRVLTANQRGDGFHALTFSATEVQGVAEIDPDHSALILRSGAEIPVALSYKDLEQKIYSPNIRTDDSVLDLRDLTGEVAKPKIPANTNQCAASNQSSGASVGDRMPDGTVFAGISPDTNKPMYATPADASVTMKFNEAQKYAAKFDAHNHKDWHVPTRNELNVLFNNRAAIGGFNVTGSLPAGWYWSATPNDQWDAWGQRFGDGLQDN